MDMLRDGFRKEEEKKGKENNTPSALIQCPCHKLKPIDHHSPRYGLPLKEVLSAQAVPQDARRVFCALVELLFAFAADRVFKGLECIGCEKFGGNADVPPVGIEWAVANRGIITPSKPRFPLGGGIVEA